MYTTNHYGLNIVEGSDVVNPLVQQNPNFENIDEAMFANKQASIGSATELTAGTVHTITRANTDSNYIRFTATSNWTAGDSMVVDSTPVSVYLSDGTTPKTGAYVINTEVLMLVNGSRVTLLASGTQNAAATPFTPNADISATNTQGAIEEVFGDIPTEVSELQNDRAYYAFNNVSGRTYNVTIGNAGHVTDIVLKHSGGANAYVGKWIQSELIPVEVAGGAFTVTVIDSTHLTITASIAYYVLGITSSEKVTVTVS